MLLLFPFTFSFLLFFLYFFLKVLQLPFIVPREGPHREHSLSWARRDQRQPHVRGVVETPRTRIIPAIGHPDVRHVAIGVHIGEDEGRLRVERRRISRRIVVV